MVSLDEEELVKWFTKPGLKPIRKAKLAKGHSQLVSLSCMIFNGA